MGVPARLPKHALLVLAVRPRRALPSTPSRIGPPSIATTPHQPVPQAGGNDYVTKPFGQKELVARIQAQLRTREFSQGVRPQGEPSPLEDGQQQQDGQQQRQGADGAGGAGGSTNDSGAVASANAGPSQTPGQPGAAAPAAIVAADVPGVPSGLQHTVDRLQRQLLETQQQLAVLAAAAGSPAVVKAVVEAVASGTEAAAAPPSATNGDGTHSGSGSLESGSPERRSSEVPHEPAAAPAAADAAVSTPICQGSATSRDSGASLAAA